MSHGAPITLAVVNLKGGSSKTTTCVFLAHALHEQGRRVLVVDSDPQQSAMRWADYAGGFPFPLTGELAGRSDLHRRLPGVVGDQRYDAVLIDTPPIEAQRGAVISALVAATDVLVPVAPTPLEIERLDRVDGELRRAAGLRISGEPPHTSVLLTRTVAGASSTAVWREHLEQAGHRVLRAHVGRLERFAQSYGGPIERASATAYGDAALELLDGVGQ
jgi:chromosome partitioning protein